jgi:1,4-alpha-glucan branching enzyme
MWSHPGKQLLFMGSELAQGSEWSADRGLDWWVLDFDFHAGVQRLVRDLNLAYREHPELWALDASPEGFSWIDANDAAGNVLSFLRHGPDGQLLACIVNFSGGTHAAYRVGLPRPGRWLEVINTDAFDYGGSGAGNLGAVEAVPEPWHGQPASAVLTIPPLGMLWLSPEQPPDLPPGEPAQQAQSAKQAQPARQAQPAGQREPGQPTQTAQATGQAAPPPEQGAPPAGETARPPDQGAPPAGKAVPPPEQDAPPPGQATRPPEQFGRPAGPPGQHP